MIHTQGHIPSRTSEDLQRAGWVLWFRFDRVAVVTGITRQHPLCRKRASKPERPCHPPIHRSFQKQEPQLLESFFSATLFHARPSLKQLPCPERSPETEFCASARLEARHSGTRGHILWTWQNCVYGPGIRGRGSKVLSSAWMLYALLSC